MSELRFDFEWLEEQGVRGPELRGTWSRLRIEFDGQPITRVFDRSSRSVRENIYVPLYPLAEWIATHWWFIFGEVETPGKFPSNEYEQRHSIRFGQPGYSFPALSLSPVGADVHLHWTPFAPEYRSAEFIGEGSGFVENSAIALTLSALVESVIQRLEEQDIKNTILHQEWSAVRSAEAEERDFCLSAASLGIDPYTVESADAATIISVSDKLPKSVLSEFFPVATVEALQSQADLVLHALSAALNTHDRFRSLLELKQQLAVGDRTNARPWNYGYSLARQLRAHLGLNGRPIVTSPDLSSALSLSGEALAAMATAAVQHLSNVDAVLNIAEDLTPGFAIPSRSDQTTRFSFCRALFEYLVSSESEARLVTRAHSDRQKSNRAFAAEFLLPADTLRTVVPGDTVPEEAVDDLAANFGVSSLVVRHQLENHRIARIESA